MTQKLAPRTATLLIPEDIRDLLGNRPLVFGETPELYDALLSKVVAAVNPKDIFEWLYLKDVVDLTWEIQRIRRFQSALIDDEIVTSLAGLLDAELNENGRFSTTNKFPPDAEEQLARAYIAGNPKAKKDVTSLLAKKGLAFDMDLLVALAFNRQIPTLEIIDRMLASAETRRDKVLRYIERRQQNFALRIQQAVAAETSEVTLIPNVIESGKNTPKIEKRNPTNKEENAA